jgi:hypothetical protein
VPLDADDRNSRIGKDAADRGAGSQVFQSHMIAITTPTRFPGSHGRGLVARNRVLGQQRLHAIPRNMSVLANMANQATVAHWYVRFLPGYNLEIRS